MANSDDDWSDNDDNIDESKPKPTFNTDSVKKIFSGPVMPVVEKPIVKKLVIDNTSAVALLLGQKLEQKTGNMPSNAAKNQSMKDFIAAQRSRTTKKTR